MKKMIALLLVMGMLLSLCACGGDPMEAALQEADALVAAGEYEAAIQAYSSIESYWVIAGKIAEAEYLLQEQKREEDLQSVGKYYGTWYDLNSEIRITIGENNVCTVTYSDSNGEHTSEPGYWYEDGNMYLHWFSSEPVRLQEVDGVTHLYIEEYWEYDDTTTYYDFVPEADYARLGPEMVTITTDNWQDYFEIKSGPYWTKNDFGEVDDLSYQTVLCIREEYADQVVWDRSDITFGYEYDEMLRYYTADLEARTLSIGGIFDNPRYHGEDTFVLPASYVADNSMGNAVYIIHGSYIDLDMTNFPYVGTADNLQITRAQGTLAIKK